LGVPTKTIRRTVTPRHRAPGLAGDHPGDQATAAVADNVEVQSCARGQALGEDLSVLFRVHRSGGVVEGKDAAAVGPVELLEGGVVQAAEGTRAGREDPVQEEERSSTGETLPVRRRQLRDVTASVVAGGKAAEAVRPGPAFPGRGDLASGPPDKRVDDRIHEHRQDLLADGRDQ